MPTISKLSLTGALISLAGCTSGTGLPQSSSENGAEPGSTSFVDDTRGDGSVTEMSCGPNPAKIPVYEQLPCVPPACPLNCGGESGRTVTPFGNVDVTESLCLTTLLWETRVERVDVQYTSEVCPQGRVEIKDGTESAIHDEESCRQVLEDFTPIQIFDAFATLASPRSPQVKFFPTECIVLHENTHVEEYISVFETSWPEFERRFEELNRPLSEFATANAAFC